MDGLQARNRPPRVVRASTKLAIRRGGRQAGSPIENEDLPIAAARDHPLAATPSAALRPAMIAPPTATEMNERTKLVWKKR
jgi:hypothetical protein